MQNNGVVNRYLPFLAIAALQLVLIATQPVRAPTAVSTGFPGQGQGAGAGFGGQGFTGGGGPTVGGPSAGSAAAPGANAPSGAGGQAVQSPGGGAAAPARGGQPVDGLGRPLSGDTSKCGPGGLLQQEVTRLSPPCMPRFVGDNAGATYPGVTGDKIVGVYYIPPSNPTTEQALATQGLAAAPARYEETLELYEKFHNKHYELYGRQMQWVMHQGSCQDDPNCPQIEAKAMIEKYKPFMFIYWTGQGTPIAMVDEFARAGVVTVGAPTSMPDTWFQQRAPYVWGWFPSGGVAADGVADYYCKKMHGKDAAYAGDPTLRVQTRKLGILATDQPDIFESAERLRTQVTGGRCGSDADGTTVYTISTDPAQQQEQANVVATRMKNDGITTVHSVTSAGCTTNCDQQAYYPENLIGAPFSLDHDFVFRLLQPSRAQAQNTFGIGWLADDGPVQDSDNARAARDVAPGSNVTEAVLRGSWYGMSTLAWLIQQAGPYLTPGALQAGAEVFPQMNGWVNPNPWQGWVCCNPEVQGVRFFPGDFTAVSDAREVYWSESSPSKVDGKPGAFLCPGGECKRWFPGDFLRGEPKQP